VKGGGEPLPHTRTVCVKGVPRKHLSLSDSWLPGIMGAGSGERAASAYSWEKGGAGGGGCEGCGRDRAASAYS
jgi:hypothetical protein